MQTIGSSSEYIPNTYLLIRTPPQQPHADWGDHPLLVMKTGFIHESHKVATEGALKVHHCDNIVCKVSANFTANLLGADRSEHDRYVQWWYGRRNADIEGSEDVD